MKTEDPDDLYFWAPTKIFFPTKVSESALKYTHRPSQSGHFDRLQINKILPERLRLRFPGKMEKKYHSGLRGFEDSVNVHLLKQK